MKNLIFSLAFLFVISSGYSQLRIIEAGLAIYENGEMVIIEPAGTVDLSGTTQLWEHEPTVNSVVAPYWIVNESETETLSVVCRRIEIDVAADTETYVLWYLSPIGSLLAGEIPDWTVGAGPFTFVESIAPGDTVTSFEFTYFPEGVSGCSLYEIRFAAEEDEDLTYASFNIEFQHGCQVGLEETYAIETLSLFPNPAKDLVRIDLSKNVGQVILELTNSLGELVDRQIIQGGSIVAYDTFALSGGVYNVSVRNDRQILSMSKLSVQR